MFIVENTSDIHIRQGLISSTTSHKIPGAFQDDGNWYLGNHGFLFELESSECHICQPHVDVLDTLRSLKCYWMSVSGKLI